MSYEVGEDGVVPSLDETVTGLNADESATFVFTPEFGEYAGTPIDVTVKVGAVCERIMPEIDDELAMMASRVRHVGRTARRSAARLGGSAHGARPGSPRVGERAVARLGRDPAAEGIITAEVDQHFGEPR